MKFNKIIAMLLIVAFGVCALVACSGDKEPGDDVATEIDPNAPIELEADEIAVDIQITTDDFDEALTTGTVVLKQGSSVLNAITAFCNDKGIDCVFEEVEDGEDPETVSALGNFKSTPKAKEKSEKFIYYWQVFVNEAELSGTAADNEVANGDVIRYNYTSIPNGPVVTVRFETEDGVLVEDTLVVYEEGESIIDAAVYALEANDMEYVQTENSLRSVEDYLAKKTPIYDDIWEITVGKNTYTSDDDLTAIALYEGQEIVFTFKRIEKDVE